MRFKKIDVVFVIGAFVILGPVYIDYWPGNWWYWVMLISGVFMMIVGKGALMDQLGQGDTGEELLQEMWVAIKKRSLRVREFFSSKNKP